MSELEKVRAFNSEISKLEEFLGWLDDQGIKLVVVETDLDVLERNEQIVRRYLGIDGKKLEAERRALLEQVQSRYEK